MYFVFRNYVFLLCCYKLTTATKLNKKVIR